VELGKKTVRESVVGIVLILVLAYVMLGGYFKMDHPIATGPPFWF
jgi:hypothetical protein